MEPRETPVHSVSRPALQLLEGLGFGRSQLSFENIERTASRPKATVARYIHELEASALLARLRRDAYATPWKTTALLIMHDSSPYYRSLLLWNDILPMAGHHRYAFACLPVQRFLDFEFPRAVPVAPLGGDLTKPAVRSSEIMRYSYSPKQVGAAELLFPRDASEESGAMVRSFPVLDPATALALFAATSDPRIVIAVRKAASRLGLRTQDVFDQALELRPERPPLPVLRQNTVVYPPWIEKFVASAHAAHAHEYVRTAAARSAGTS